MTTLPLAHLHPHPLHANRLPRAAVAKLARLIARTGRYEPLVVRPHPHVPGEYELLHGHARKAALASLGRAAADCLVWPLADADTLLFLATVNRLRGKEAAARRLALLEAATAALGPVPPPHHLLPEDERTLQSLLHPPAKPPTPPPADALPEALTLFLPAADKRSLLAALARTHPDPATALLAWKAVVSTQ
jgi:hypothetical protein